MGTRYEDDVNRSFILKIAVPVPEYLKKYAGNPGGTEHIGIEDTLDLDYGLALERAYAQVGGKGVASPRRFEPVLPRFRLHGQLPLDR